MAGWNQHRSRTTWSADHEIVGRPATDCCGNDISVAPIGEPAASRITRTMTADLSRGSCFDNRSPAQKTTAVFATVSSGGEKPFTVSDAVAVLRAFTSRAHSGGGRGIRP